MDSQEQAPSIPKVHPPTPDEPPLVRTSTLREVTQALSDDAFEGRGTGSPGGRRASAWVAQRMQTLGLRAPNDGPQGYFAPVPLRGHKVHDASIRVRSKRRSFSIRWLEDFVGTSWNAQDDVVWSAPVVFAGYGIVARSHGWNAFDDVDVHGKTVVMLSGLPPSATFDDAALHGRWTTKLEHARTRGAASCLIIHDDVSAGYGWNVVQSSFGGEQFRLREDASTSAFEGWISEDAARSVAAAAGTQLGTLRTAAARTDFRAHPLPVRLEGSLTLHRRDVVERNVVGLVGNGSPAVVVSAHWDHLGRLFAPDGAKSSDASGGSHEDPIFNGAIDNATGVASMLALAEAAQIRHQTQPLVGTLVFVATAAEEHGLLGAKSFTRNPAVPVDTIVAAINFDAMNPGPTTTTVEIVGAGSSSLDHAFTAALVEQGRDAVPDRFPAAGAAFRSDHHAFVQAGIPTLFFQPGFTDSLDPSVIEFARVRATRYHTVADAFDPAWSFEGARLDTQAALLVALRIVDGEILPRKTENTVTESAR